MPSKVKSHLGREAGVRRTPLTFTQSPRSRRGFKGGLSKPSKVKSHSRCEAGVRRTPLTFTQSPRCRRGFKGGLSKPSKVKSHLGREAGVRRTPLTFTPSPRCRRVFKGRSLHAPQGEITLGPRSRRATNTADFHAECAEPQSFLKEGDWPHAPHVPHGEPHACREARVRRSPLTLTQSPQSRRVSSMKPPLSPCSPCSPMFPMVSRTCAAKPACAEHR
jgi:hypothetical protein